MAFLFSAKYSAFAIISALFSTPVISGNFNSNYFHLASVSLLPKESGSVVTDYGPVQKFVGNPLFNQSEAWEPRIDNGYPNVMYDTANPRDAQSPWRLWYGDCVQGCGNQILLYADSKDGYTWTKPDLGLFDLAQVSPDLAKYSTHNNVIMSGGGIGIYLDPNAVSISQKYKAFGEGCFGSSPTNCTKVSGIATSPDGFKFYNVTALSWPAPQRYDTHNNVSVILWNNDGIIVWLKIINNMYAD